jgi:hypothetical protein
MVVLRPSSSCCLSSRSRFMAKYPSTDSTLCCSTSLSLSVSLPFCCGRGDSLVPKRQWKLRQIITADVVSAALRNRTLDIHRPPVFSTTRRAPFLPWWSFGGPTETPCPASHDEEARPLGDVSRWGAAINKYLASWLSPSLLLLLHECKLCCIDEEDDEDDADNDDGSCSSSSITYY